MVSYCNSLIKEKLYESLFFMEDFNKYIFKNDVNFSMEMLGHDCTRNDEVVDSCTDTWHH